MTQEEMEKFIKDVHVYREDTDDCEYEVTQRAMEFYKTYPCYEGWKSILHGNSLANYMRYPDQKHRVGYRGVKNYQGAHLLVSENDNKYLTADLLTSIRTPLNDILEKNGQERVDMTGEEIINGIYKDKKLGTYLGDYLPYIKVFAYVYYWCGNMMPVIYNPGMGSNDNVTYKMSQIEKFFKEPNKDKSDADTLHKLIKSCRSYPILWKMWIDAYWSEESFENFVKQNYLNDVNEWNNCCRPVSISDYKKWFIDISKIIIQRSYRIQKKINVPFSQEHIENLQTMFIKIFSSCGIDEKMDIEIIGRK